VRFCTTPPLFPVQTRTLCGREPVAGDQSHHVGGGQQRPKL